MNIVFMGTPEFSVPCLNALIKKGHIISGVFTQPDRPKGRGHKLVATPIKEVAQSHGIPVFQPEKVKSPEMVEQLRKLQPEVIVVVAFGQLLSQEILDIPKYGCINVHASLLPKYRGAAPINWVLIHGEKKTGVTTMFMSKGLDTGDMLLKSEFEIPYDYRASDLYGHLSDLGAELLLKTLDQIEDGEITREVQNDEESCYAPMLTKTLGKINWSDGGEKIRNLIRGVTPWPCAYTDMNGKIVKIHEASVVEGNIQKPVGCIYRVETDAIYVACGENALRITQLQFENEKKMSVEAYLRGHNIEKDIILK